MTRNAFLQIDTDRLKVVYEETAVGSEPRARFYVMVALSTLIACFGLVADSTAVVIGAMLVAPLMTPIFGISLALVRGDTRLFRNAVRAEIAGIIFAIGMGFLLGLLLTVANPFQEATSEMLARTKPNLFDLLVAVLAGSAGTYALIDEKISPALPGVAIATAIVPPLANCGLCLAFGAYRGALGSFLLFFANFLSILVVASILFIKAGMGREFAAIKKKDIVRRFGWAAVCFLVVSVLLGNALYKMVQGRRLKNTVRNVLVSEFSKYPATKIDRILLDKKDNLLFVLAELKSPTQFNPNQVQDFETELTEETQYPTELIVRVVKSSDISSSGSYSIETAQGLDGFFVNRVVNPKVQKVRLAEQVIREFLDDHIGLDLLDVDYMEAMRGPTILAMISGIRKLSLKETDQLESLIRQRASDPALYLILRFVHVDLRDKEGAIRVGWTTFIDLDKKQLEIRDNILRTIRKEFSGIDTLVLDHINSSMTDEAYAFLIEVSGVGPYGQTDLKHMQEKLNTLSDKPVNIYVWFNQGAVVTDRGLVSYDRLTEARLEFYSSKFKQRIQELLKEAL